MIEFDPEKKSDFSAVTIKIIGIGGAGGNTVNSMIESGIQDIEFIVANSDVQALKKSQATRKIQLGIKTTKGLGCGANPELGRRATEEDIDKIIEQLDGADIVFLVAGMGGGTGSGGTAVVARALKERGILTVGVVTKPFSFEGKRRMIVAEQALAELQKEVDTLIVVPNEKLLGFVDRSLSMIESFNMINDLLIASVKSIYAIISQSGHINVDFADLCTIMRGMGLALMGTGKASGKDRASVAAQRAIESPLLEHFDIKSAKGILLNISGNSSLSLHEISDVAHIIYELSDKNAHIIIGTVIDESLHDELVVSVIATGFQMHTEEIAATKQSAPDSVIKHEVFIESIKPVVKQQDVMLEQIKVTKSEYKQDELDIPAFLRPLDSGKQVDR